MGIHISHTKIPYSHLVWRLKRTEGKGWHTNLQIWKAWKVQILVWACEENYGYKNKNQQRQCIISHRRIFDKDSNKKLSFTLIKKAIKKRIFQTKTNPIANILITLYSAQRQEGFLRFNVKEDSFLRFLSQCILAQP